MISLDNPKKLVILLVASVLIIYTIPQMMSSAGYITGYQGLQAEFSAVRFKNYWYDTVNVGPNPDYTPPPGGPDNPWDDHEGWTASANEFFDHVNFDPDDAATYLPNLGLSQQPISVDTDYGTQVYGPWAIKIGEKTTVGKNDTHSWFTTIEEYKEFQITRYRCEWAVNIWLSGNYYEASPSEVHAWMDTQIWIRLVPQAFVYFENNPDKVYFAPAKIQLESIEWWSTDQTGEESTSSSISQYQDIFPEARGDTVGIFYSKDGQSVDPENKVLNYQGAILDPAVFRDEYWVRFSLQLFRPVSWWNDPLHLTGWSYEFPSAKLEFEVFVFVVGEWTVLLEKGETVKLEVHEAQEIDTSPFTGFYTWLAGVQAWLANPLNQIGLGMFGVSLFAVACIAVLVFVFGVPYLRRPRRQEE